MKKSFRFISGEIVFLEQENEDPIECIIEYPKASNYRISYNFYRIQGEFKIIVLQIYFFPIDNMYRIIVNNLERNKSFMIRRKINGDLYEFPI